MARQHNRLTQKRIDHARPKGTRKLMLADGDGLYLECSLADDGKTVRKSWTFRFERDGVRREMGVGPLRVVGLAEARATRRTLRQALLDGHDPLEARRQQREARRAEAAALAAERAKALTFEQCAERCMAAHRAGWSNVVHAEQWKTSLETYAFPVLGKLRVADIDVSHIVQVLEPIWSTKPETASRVRGRVEKVLAWATVRGFRHGDNPARWRGHLAELFPAKGKVQRVEHYAAMDYAEVPGLLAELRERESVAARALEFLVLCAGRTAEVTGARWDEIDKSRVWNIPAGRMKAKRAHAVPLSPRAVQILESLPRHGEHVFGGSKGLNSLSMSRLLRTMRGRGPTIHGFRASFKTWASERTSYATEIVETSLAHAVGNLVERSYKRTDLLDKRRRLMEQWAAFCSKPMPKGDTVVVPMRMADADA